MTHWLSVRRRLLTSLFLFTLAFALGPMVILQSGGEAPTFVPRGQESPLADLLQWIPATDETERGYSAWVALPGTPMGVTDALDRLSLMPRPLALGRSGEFQRTTGISASQVTGWAAAYDAGVSVLTGQFDSEAIADALRDAGYEDDLFRGVTIWTAPAPRAESRTIDGDDLRAMNFVAPIGDRVLVAHDRASIEAALDAASGREESLADQPVIREWALSGQTAGIMVVDLRDLAVECGVAGQWRTSDFTEPSGRTVGVVYRLADGEPSPVTSVWIDLGDDLAAEAGVFTFAEGWRNGFVNQTGFGAAVSALATVSEVRNSGTFVVADLVQGRDDGWVRSGVRYLIDICEHSSALVPAGQPNRATPVASPLPEESQ